MPTRGLNLVLTLICPFCGQTFPSGIQMDPNTWEGIRMDWMRELCPHCHRASRVAKGDYLFRQTDE
jgi:hypothetical protein